MFIDPSLHPRIRRKRAIRAPWTRTSMLWGPSGRCQRWNLILGLPSYPIQEQRNAGRARTRRKGPHNDASSTPHPRRHVCPGGALAKHRPSWASGRRIDGCRRTGGGSPAPSLAGCLHQALVHRLGSALLCSALLWMADEWGWCDSHAPPCICLLLRAYMPTRYTYSLT